MSETPDLGLPLPVDGQTPWGDDYRDAMTKIDDAVHLLRGIRTTSSLLNNVTATDITTQNIYVKARLPGAVSTSYEGLMDFPAENRYRYIGDVDRSPVVAVSFDLATTGNNQTVRVAVAKNGVVDETVAITVRNLTSPPANGTAFGVIDLEPGDYLEVFVRNQTSDNDVTIRDLNLLVRG